MYIHNYYEWNNCNQINEDIDLNEQLFWGNLEYIMVKVVNFAKYCKSEGDAYKFEQ